MIVAARDHLLKTESRLGKPLAPATVKLYIESLSAVFKTARKEWRWTQYNPCGDVTRPKLPKGRVRFLSDAERTALLDECKKSSDRRLYPFVLLAISTGARAGELTGLLWSDVDLERGTASLRKTKNGDMRALPVKGAALIAIKAMHVKGTDPETHVFADPRGPIFDYQDPFTRARDEAGIKNFRFHDCRHCTGSYLAMNGASASGNPRPYSGTRLCKWSAVCPPKRWACWQRHRAHERKDFPGAEAGGGVHVIPDKKKLRYTVMRPGANYVIVGTDMKIEELPAGTSKAKAQELCDVLNDTNKDPAKPSEASRSFKRPKSTEPTGASPFYGPKGTPGITLWGARKPVCRRRIERTLSSLPGSSTARCEKAYGAGAKKTFVIGSRP